MSDYVLVVEGEGDALAALSAGFRAVAVPGIAAAKRIEAERFAGLHAVVIPDCDEYVAGKRPTGGREAAWGIAHDLLPHAASVRLLDLEPARDDGYDLTDFLAEAKTPEERAQAAAALRRAIDDLTPLSPIRVNRDDPVTTIGSATYLPLLTGCEVVDGRADCPLPCHRYGERTLLLADDPKRGFVCIRCRRRGGIIGFASHLYGLDPRRDYTQIKKRVLDALIAKAKR